MEFVKVKTVITKVKDRRIKIINIKNITNLLKIYYIFITINESKPILWYNKK